MKKYCGMIVLGALASATLAACQAADRSVDTPMVADAPDTRVATLDNADIEIPEGRGRVQLHNGTGTFEIAPGSSMGKVTLIDGSQQVWRSENRTDIVAVLAVDNGGSGHFYYAAVYTLKAGGTELTGSVFLGDRIKITHAGIGELTHDPQADYRITIKLLERAADAPMASEPNIPVTRVFYVTDGKLQAVTPGRDDS